MKRTLSFMLVLAMVLSLVACGTQTAQTEQQPQQAQSNRVEEIVEDMTREEKESVVQILGDGQQAELLPEMTDEELDITVDKLLSDLTQSTPEYQAPETQEEDGIYDENGAMTEPFDQVFPEDLENGAVIYDNETVLVKLSNSQQGRITDGMAAAGVAALDCIVPMEDASWYEARLVEGTDAETAIQALRQLSEVLLVEYNYEIQAAVMDDYKEFDEDHDYSNNDRFEDQWYKHHCGIPDATKEMQTDGGSSSVIVAVIDSGVDYDHEDLADNIWINAGEIPDNGKDDDGNGYIDDYYGVNIITGKGNGDDDNGHGTHVAGIIAAKNNNLGVVGIAYNVQIMPIKAAMASGTLLQSDIAKAVLYAYDMGAEVINMSFGGTACSIAVQDALAVAYSRCVLVASAGNDGEPNEVTDKDDTPKPNYPAALTYVLGVMSVGRNGVESGFTNWDVQAYNGVEYELYAPGEAMMSTLPDNRYGYLSGTSMAAPVVAAMAAILRSEFADRDTYPTKFIYGQLCATSQNTAICCDPENHVINGKTHEMAQIVNLYAALTQLPNPDVNMQDYSLFDTETIADGNNGDGVIDAGETIALGLTLRNRWGMSKDTVVTIDALSSAGIADPYVTIQNPTVNYGSVGTYSTQNCGAIYTDELLTGWENPFYITVAADCPNDYIIKLNVTVTCANGLDEEDAGVYTNGSEIWLYVRNGVVLPSVIEEDMVLTSDNLYIIPNSTVIQEGVTVRVEPGTHIQFWTADPEDPYASDYIAYLQVEGNFLVEGTQEDPVYIYPSDLMSEYIVQIYTANCGFVSLTHADITNFLSSTSNNGDCWVDYADHCTFRMNYDYMKRRCLSNGLVKNDTVNTTYMRIMSARACTFYKLDSYYSADYHIMYGMFEQCVFVDSKVKCEAGFGNVYRNCLFLGNCADRSDEYSNATVTVDDFVKEFSTDYAQSLHNPDTGTTYIRICFGNLSSTAVLYDNWARYLALVDYVEQVLGGNLAVLETEAEYTYLQENGAFRYSYHYTVVGLQRDAQGTVCWSDGTPVGSFLPQDLKKVTYRPQLCLNYGGTVTYVDKKSTFYALFEIPEPDATEEDHLTAEAVMEGALAFLEETQYNGAFYGNAILNRISTDTDVTHWMRVFAPSVSEYTEIPLGGNYWGTTNETAIGLQMLDYTDYIDYGRLMYAPYLTQPPENTFPFVTDITILNKEGQAVTTVGNETITVRVTFNRDMDTTIPLNVRFGSAEPYADYTIEGSYVDDRTWEGTYTLKTLIENGSQYWNISNGCSATEGLALYADVARFTFEIDTTAAQALIMQGSATETGIQLSWMQDDFDTLMGYNIYRSTSEDGYYQRLNSSVIPADVTEWFDNTVEPGVVYYYNFTVVKTDLTESEPSGKITIMSMDTMAPDIYHSPVYSAFTGANLIISATITDNLMITGAKVYFRTVGETEWRSVTMTNNNSKYSAIIPAEYLSTDGLEYYIEAFDGISYTYKGGPEQPYQVTVQQAIDKNSMGDVNGDGVITNLDALMLLQAVNDLLNLDAEQFARADLDGDGILTAAEALRILMYVSGAVGDLNMGGG